MIDSDDAIANSLEAVRRSRQTWEERPRPASPATAYEEFLKYLRTCVPYYRDLDAAAELPLVGRSDHQDDGGRFRAEPADGPQYRLSSSGTTGRPLDVTLDDPAWYAVNYHFFAQIRELAGLPRDAFRRGAPGVVFVSNKPGRPSFVRPLPPLDDALYLRLQLPESGADTLALFQKFQAPVLYGKPTYLLDLRAALLGQGAVRPPWRPQLILVSGEPLHADDRERLTGYFEAPIVDALASTEGGLIAATAPDGATYHVFGENVRLEVLGGSGRPAPGGRGELVLTNLVNRSTVFARYRTGDLAELETAEDGTQRLLALRGREPEKVRFRTAELPADEVTRAVGFVPGLADFQFVLSDPDRTLLRWSPEAACADPGVLAAALRDAVAGLLPAEHPDLEQCARITPLGGKKRRFLLGTTQSHFTDGGILR
ncbi:hypothetical protein [Streptomyces sp. ISL-100]|uniref:hypothetical protein n=1 Tax=Streptomyces sp. ISL-100 TaxID=2819173 RepID=UPI001BEAEB17|nr:hypothetical protein [Streptomyces sp. ISL-100]MBT2399353.1 hypothetical protein [Streptomyces sp. ISL-100]